MTYDCWSVLMYVHAGVYEENFASQDIMDNCR